MAKQCLDIKQMQHLQELGLDTSNASMCWVKDAEGNRQLSVHDEYCYEANFMNPIPAYTLQDVLDALPKRIYPFPSHRIAFELWIGIEKIFYANMFNLEDVLKVRHDEELIDAAYELLVWCIEQGYVETKRTDKDNGIK